MYISKKNREIVRTIAVSFIENNAKYDVNIRFKFSGDYLFFIGFLIIFVEPHRYNRKMRSTIKNIAIFGE